MDFDFTEVVARLAALLATLGGQSGAGGVGESSNPAPLATLLFSYGVVMCVNQRDGSGRRLLSKLGRAR